MSKHTPKLRSLIVGINEFKYLLPKNHLKGCVDDAKKFHAYLQEMTKNSRNPFDYYPEILHNADATRDNIIKTFDTHLIQKAQKGDKVVFFFAGHGGQEKANNVFLPFEHDKLLEGLVCHDSGKGGNQKIADKELRYLIYELSKKECEIITIFDCCHSGDNTRMEEDPEKKGRLKERLYATKTQNREWEEFLFHDKSIRSQRAYSTKWFTQ